MSFSATYPGRCGCCDDHFPAGTEIAFSDDDGLVIAEHLKEDKPKPVCPTCFIQLPATGKCDNCA